MAKTNFLLELLADTLATIGESKLVEVLQDLHEKDTTDDKSDYKSVLFGGLSFVTGISKLTDKTKTKIDDALVNAIKEAIEASAAANDVEL
jgi:uncharacterized protein (UPF0210 family)